jgi:hypothetical protein
MVPLWSLSSLAVCAARTIALPCTWSRSISRSYQHEPEQVPEVSEGRVDAGSHHL